MGHNILFAVVLYVFDVNWSKTTNKVIFLLSKPQQHLCLYLKKNNNQQLWNATRAKISNMCFMRFFSPLEKKRAGETKQRKRESGADFQIMTSEHLISLCEPKRRGEGLRGLRERWLHERVCCCPSRGRDKKAAAGQKDGWDIREQREREIWWFMTFLVSVILIS